jgi:predicted aspartyl protease
VVFNHCIRPRPSSSSFILDGQAPSTGKHERTSVRTIDHRFAAKKPKIERVNLLGGTDMRYKGDNTMGRFSVEFEVANGRDIMQVELGQLSADKVRRVRLQGVVDPGATRLVLPTRVVKKLGLPVIQRIPVRYADGRKARRDLVDYARVYLQGRQGLVDAIAEPKRRTALIGAFVLEVLDFLVDCQKQRLVPRDPKHIMAEIE